MLITHDTRCALDAVVDLVNTAPDGESAETEGLADVAALGEFVRSHDISDVGVLTERDLAGCPADPQPLLRGLRLPEPQAAAAVINELVAAAGTTPRLTDHDGYDWHVHYFAPGASIADHLAADCGMALAFFVVAGEQERLRRCEAPDSPARLRGSLPQSLAPLLRQPDLREPAARGRLPGPPQGSRGLSPAPHGYSLSRSCSEPIRSRKPITARKIIRGGWESAKRQPCGSSVGAARSSVGGAASPGVVVSSISRR